MLQQLPPNGKEHFRKKKCWLWRLKGERGGERWKGTGCDPDGTGIEVDGTRMEIERGRERRESDPDRRGWKEDVTQIERYRTQVTWMGG